MSDALPEPRYMLPLTGEQAALVLVHAHVEYRRNLKMARAFVRASEIEHADHLAALAASFTHEAANWHHIGLTIEAGNPDLEPEDWTTGLEFGQMQHPTTGTTETTDKQEG